MTNNQDDQKFNQQLQVMQILNVALFASVAVLGFVGNMIPGGSAENFPMGSKLFAALAAAVAVASFVVPKVLIKSVIAGRKNIELQDLFTGFILSLTLSEAVGIFGLLSKIQTGDVNMFWGLLGCSALLVAIRFPTREKMQGTLAALKAGVNI